MRPTAILAAAIFLALAVGPALTGANSAPATALAGCAPGPAEAAARALIHPGATVTADDEDIAGFRTALALAPTVYPGVRHRLLAAGDMWCDAQDGFNAAWRLNGRPMADARGMSQAFAQVAAAPWFDGVTIDASGTLAGVTKMVTHARTNGVVAAWTITTDAAGIRHATFQSQRIAVAPYDFSLHGLTALPGFVAAFARGSDGALALQTGGLPDDAPSASPGLTLTSSERMSDGFRINVYRGTALGPSFNSEVGQFHTDIMYLTRTTARENYEEFLSWGLRKGWTSDVGAINVDGPIALQCFACVQIAQNFQIHISSLVMEYLNVAGGASYPDTAQGYSLIIGHEMMHNFQNAYYKPGGNRYMDSSYSEGTARFQEVLHTYAAVSHQPRSLLYANNLNGCNGYVGSDHAASVASGPGTGRAYSACMFWLPWYAEHGIDRFVAMMAATFDHAPLGAWDEFKLSAQQATGAPIDDDLARMARAMLTGHGLSVTTPAGDGPVDWSKHMERWRPTPMSPGGSGSAAIADGGMAGWRLTSGGTVTVAADDSVSVYLVSQTSNTASTLTRVTSPVTVASPAPDEGVWLVVIEPDTRETNIAVSFA